MTQVHSKKDAVSDSNSEKAEGRGSFQLLPQQVRVDFDDGSAVVAPLGEATISARSVGVSAGDIITIACKLFPSLCGGGGGGCYIIIGPDGTKITICPPKFA